MWGLESNNNKKVALMTIGLGEAKEDQVSRLRNVLSLMEGSASSEQLIICKVSVWRRRERR